MPIIASWLSSAASETLGMKGKTAANNTMLTRSTMRMNEVPQRGWSVVCRAAFCGVSPSPFSKVQIALCSAPWYSKTRRMSGMREISAR